MRQLCCCPATCNPLHDLSQHGGRGKRAQQPAVASQEAQSSCCGSAHQLPPAPAAAAPGGRRRRCHLRQKQHSTHDAKLKAGRGTRCSTRAEAQPREVQRAGCPAAQTLRPFDATMSPVLRRPHRCSSPRCRPAGCTCTDTDDTSTAGYSTLWCIPTQLRCPTQRAEQRGAVQGAPCGQNTPWPM